MVLETRPQLQNKQFITFDTIGIIITKHVVDTATSLQYVSIISSIVDKVNIFRYFDAYMHV